MFRRFLSHSLLALILGSTAFVSAPVSARTWVDVSVGIAPPAPRFERVVVRPGYAWSPGYWRWNGACHVWVGGYWLPARAGYRYVGAAWVRVGPAWHFRAAHWSRY